MIKVFLREKKLLHGKLGLYLDFYPPIVNSEANKSTRREHLRLYVYAKPKTQTQKDHNKETRLIGENIRSQRQIDLQAGAYGYVASQHRRRSFLDYILSVQKSKAQLSKSTRQRWKSLHDHLQLYSKGNITFGTLDRPFCVGFRDYLEHSAGLDRNTAASYFDAFRSAITLAFKTGLFRELPLNGVKGVKKKKTQRNFLTLDELKRVATSDCPVPALKAAGLFSSLTGLRWVDIHKMVWEEVQHSEEMGYYVRFRQQKTDDPETLPISAEAVALLGNRRSDTERVFPTLEIWKRNYYMPQWMTAAGITKKFTFHCFRHTFATLQLTHGTDIYVLSKMLGHSDLSSTQVYAKIVDEKKREAAGRISLV